MCASHRGSGKVCSTHSMLFELMQKKAVLFSPRSHKEKYFLLPFLAHFAPRPNCNCLVERATPETYAFPPAKDRVREATVATHQ
jgi:hypothetical protein